MTMTTVGYDLYPKVKRLYFEGYRILNYSSLADFLWSSNWRILCLDRTFYSYSPHPYRREQFCELLQKQTLEERGGAEKERNKSSTGE